MLSTYLSVSISSALWLIVSKLIQLYARSDSLGNVTYSIRYSMKNGQTRWGKSETKVLPIWKTTLVIIFAIIPLGIPLLPWVLVRIILLSVYLLLVIVAIAVILPVDVESYREVDREIVDDKDRKPRHQIKYEIDSSNIPLPREQYFTIVGTAVFWVFIYFVFSRFVENYFVLIGILLVGFVASARFMYWQAMNEIQRRSYFSDDYCETCGQKFKRTQEYGPVERTHHGGNRYIIRHGNIITKMCWLCGNKQVEAF